MQRTLVAALATLGLAGCVQAPDAVPLPFAQARAVQAAPPAGTAIVMLVPPFVPGGPLLVPDRPAVTVHVDGRAVARLHPEHALLIEAPPGIPRRIAAGGGSGEADALVTGESGRPVWLTGQLLPNPGDPNARVRFLQTPEDTGRALFAARAPARADAPAPPTPSAAALRAVADPGAASAVAGGSIAPGFGRLLVAPGEWTNQRLGMAALVPMFGLTRARGDILLDGTPIGFVDGGEVLAIDLPPGTYALHWRLRSPVGDVRFSQDMAVSLPLAATVRGGETTAVQADVLDRSGANMTVAGGLAVATPTGLRYLTLTPLAPALAPRLLADRRVVVPPAAALAAVPGAALPGR